MNTRHQLLIIDPQNDFCDLPAHLCPLDPHTGYRLAPALPVPGAHTDLQRLAGLIWAVGPALDRICVTLDSHHRIDIAHPGFWRQGDGQAVAPFTSITARQVRSGQYQPRAAAALPRVLAYLDTLEQQGRYTLMVWPVHCEMGTWGHQVHAELQTALSAWEATHGTRVHTLQKGENPWTEHYSALQAEVPDAQDPHTQFNHSLVAHLDASTLLLIGGQASSHCVRATTEHLVDHLPSRQLDKVVLLTDAMSPVPGFEAQAHDFLAAMQARGVRLARCEDALALLPAAALN